MALSRDIYASWVLHSNKLIISHTILLDVCNNFHIFAFLLISATKACILPKEIETEVLQNVNVLLLTISTTKTSLFKYLQPLDGHKSIYRYNQSGQQTELVTYYYIGKYGACPAAIRYFSSEIEINGTTNTVPVMANQCFPNLGAIINVGIACGIKKKVQLCDVLVSSEVIIYDKQVDKHQEHMPEGKIITVSSQLLKLFTRPVQWPNYAMKKYLKDQRQRIPDVKSGMIFSGLYPVDNPAMTKTLVKKFAEVGIGIEMDGAYLFTENQQTTVNFIIIKAVSDFGDGKNVTVYQHTASLLSADLVHRCLSDPHAAEFFTGLHNVHICLQINTWLATQSGL